MSKYSTPDSSDISGTRINIVTSDTTTVPPCGLNVSPKIDDIRQSATPYWRKSNKLDSAIDGNFPNNMVALPIFTDVICDKISDSSRWDLYRLRWMNLVTDPVNIPAPQFVYLGLSTIDTLHKDTSIWTPATSIVRPTDISHWSAMDHIFGKIQQLETL